MTTSDERGERCEHVAEHLVGSPELLALTKLKEFYMLLGKAIHNEPWAREDPAVEDICSNYVSTVGGRMHDER